MKKTLALSALLFLAAADPRQPLFGHWTGTSICTGVRAACHDETASYWVKSGKSPDVVTIDMDKIVDGKDELMGTTDFHIDFATHALTGTTESHGEHYAWTFAWSGTVMTGTLKSPAGQVIRNVRVVKQ